MQMVEPAEHEQTHRAGGEKVGETRSVGMPLGDGAMGSLDNLQI